MNPMVIAQGASFVGDLIGGKKREKAQKKLEGKAQKYAERDYNQAMRNRDADQAEALGLMQGDEARARESHRAGIGYDLQRLRDEAKAAGFNPLTVLQNTGAANYAITPEPVLTSPFIGRPAHRDRLGALLGTSGGAVENAGYVGDAVSRGAQMFIGVGQEAARVAMDKYAIDSENQNRALDRGLQSRIYASPRQSMNSGGTSEQLWTTVRDEHGRLVRIPNMDVAADMETTVMTGINEGTLGNIAGEYLLRNTDPILHPFLRSYGKAINPATYAKAVRDLWNSFGRDGGNNTRPYNPLRLEID